jgi:hypothetical protein
MPVLVELFTSEGCSSCPPADLLLSRLQQSQPIPGVEVITLSEHVDYWNQLGWTDPFSSAVLTERQRQYAAVLRGDGVYTPQMIIDGKTGFVGSDSQKALQAISEAAKTPKTAVDLRCGGAPSTLLVRIDGPDADADVALAIGENGLQSNVTRGENRGRLMAHAGVARHIAVIGRAKKRQRFSAQPRLAIEKGWRRENLSAVVFLQDRTSRRILGAGHIALSACAVNY